MEKRQANAISSPSVQTKREIQSQLAAAGLRPRKRFGQHFLIDGNLMRRLVDVAEVDRNDLVLEVGPGTGGLTDLLVSAAGRVVAVELDRDLFQLLAGRYADASNLTLIEGDVLESKHRIRTDVAALLAEAGHPGPVKLVANLPYQVATPLVMNLLVDFPQVRRLCFTVQAEVGGRLVARPGNRDYGPLSIVSQLLCRLKVVSRLKPEVFWPAPGVDSVMIRMDRLSDAPLAAHENASEFARFVRQVFDHRRKTLRAALRLALAQESWATVADQVPDDRRPEALSVEQWLELFRKVHRGPS